MFRFEFHENKLSHGNGPVKDLKYKIILIWPGQHTNQTIKPWERSSKIFQIQKLYLNAELCCAINRKLDTWQEAQYMIEM
jgi:hypothetical protein